MSIDPRDSLHVSPMSAAQVIAVAITVGLNALDGFDVLAISFASPGIAQDWGIDRAALGFVLSMELLGMALGSIFIGSIADRIGRRRTVLSCLVLMTFGMAMVTSTHSITALCAWRIVTGLGIGGMLASINAVAAEFANERRRDLCVAVMAAGYPAGAVIGGSIAALLLQSHDWRSVFQFGALVTAAFIPLVYWLMPESIEWLCLRHPPGALATINKTLAKMRQPSATTLPPAHASKKIGFAELMSPGLAQRTLLLALAYFLHIITFYFLLKWVPKIVVDMGFAPAIGAKVLVWTNVGGLIGASCFGIAAHRISAQRLTAIVLVMSSVMLAVFGRGQADLQQLTLVAAVTGFFSNAGVVGMYAMVARAFPAYVRASGTGFVVGFGRGGSMLAPILAGFLFRAGYGLQTVALMMGLGSLLGAIVVASLKLRTPAEPIAEICAIG